MRRKRNRRRMKFLKTLAMSILIVITVATCVYASKTKEAAYDYNDVGIWVVQEGDTLWSIAKEHCNDSHDVRQVIYIIKELNEGLTADIQPRQVIDVPLFENMDWEYYSEEF